MTAAFSPWQSQKKVKAAAIQTMAANLANSDGWNDTMP